jgi:pyruvate kinase
MHVGMFTVAMSCQKTDMSHLFVSSVISKSGETAAGRYPIESLKAMASVVWEADCIADQLLMHTNAWNQDLHAKLDPLDQELDTVAAAAVRSAKDMGAAVITLISMSGAVARTVARHKPNVPVIAFCTDAQVARRLQLYRCIIPVMFHTEKDLTSAETSFGKLRAEAMRTVKELGYAKCGDRIIMIDRNPGKSHDMHKFSHNMKVVTLI